MYTELYHVYTSYMVKDINARKHNDHLTFAHIM